MKNICTGVRALVFALAALAGCAGFALAQSQSQKGPTSSIADQLKDLTARLNLSEQQQAQIKSVLEEQRQQAHAAMEGTTLSREDKLSQARSTRQTANSKIRDLLNDEQKIKFDQMEKQRRERMRASQQNSPQASPK